jgi:hypothetical protein
MAYIHCPACAAQIPEQAGVCPNCGKTLKPPAPIHGLGGKLQAIGTVMLAGAIIATVLGVWWGPALLFPGIVVFVLGRFW